MSNLHFISYEPIEKGWSHDKKYCAVTDARSKYLLRITPESRRKNHAEMFRIQQQLAQRGVPMCQVVEFGRCADGIFCVQSWIDGEDAEAAIPRLSNSRQYALGLEAGEILKTIHSIPAPDDQPDWETYFNAKIDRKIQTYHTCPIHFDGAEFIIDYINANRRLLRGRPQTFQHGDYHIGNMMVENGKLVIIDFDKCSFGDPWEEFNRIVWCAQKAPVFACGLVDGYFAGAVPAAFWKLLALYVGSNILGAVAWAVPYGEGEVQVMLTQAQDILRWYDRMRNPIPTWYCSTNLAARTTV